MATLKTTNLPQGIFIIILVQVYLSQAALPGLQTTTYDGKLKVKNTLLNHKPD